MSISGYKPCLYVYVVWRLEADAAGADKSPGGELARTIYSTFVRDIGKPLDYGLGIPLFFRSVAAGEGAPTPPTIDLERAERTAVILLVSGGMVTGAGWGDYVRELDDRVRAAGGRHRIFPVSLSKGALQFGGVRQTNFIRYHEFASEGGQNASELMLWLTHELCRFLNRPRSAQPGAVLNPQPIRLFISHAKQDGVPLAETLRDAIADTPAARFFDSVDIAPGYDFGAEIESNIRESTLLVLQSDVYSSRPWCRREVLMAKKLHRPIIIVNAIEEDEKRSFPYMGNVPVIRWTGENHQRIIGLALREHLRFLYNGCRIEALRRAGRIPEGALVLTRPPEILDFQNIAARAAGEAGKALVIYPDPPLGAEEDVLLSAFGGDVSFTTLTMPEEKRLLNGKTIGLSISESDDLQALGFGEMHLRDAMIEFTRQLLTRDATVAYGGDLRVGGFTQVLFDLVRAHNSTGAPEAYRPVHNYMAWPLHLKINEDAEAELIKVGQLHRVPLPEDLRTEPGVAADVFLKPDREGNRYVWARSLTAMRERMNEQIDARVLMGGRMRGYTGKYPGLLEEAYLALRAEKPLFLLGAFGGCARALIELVEGGNPESLTRDFQTGDEAYKQLVEEYNARAAAKPELSLEPIDYQGVGRAFREAGPGGLRNGLDAEENKQLFHAVDPDEIIHLVLKGLSNLPKGGETNN